MLLNNIKNFYNENDIVLNDMCLKEKNKSIT